MVRILFTMAPANDLGLPTRLLPLARALRALGHTVAVCNPAPALARFIADTGIENLALPPLPVPAVLAPGSSQPWNVEHMAAMVGLLDEAFVAAMTRAHLDLLVAFAPEVVVDSFGLASCLAARAQGSPLVSVLQADFHPASRGFVWWREPPADVPDPTPVLNRVAAAYGLPPVAKATELLRGDLTLVAGIPATDPLPPEAGVVYVGPLLWQDPAATLPAWATARQAGRPLVWVYAGNPRYRSRWWDSLVVLRAALAALADEAVDVVLTTGYQPLPPELDPLPANVRIAEYLPGLALAAACDLLVHHGGHGSTLTGLAAGTPAVIVPTYSERESNARRCAALGAAEVVVPTEDASGEKHVPADEFRAAVFRVLGDPSYRASAQRTAETMRGYGGVAEAAERIEQLVAP